jgi:hypothetical protein
VTADGVVFASRYFRRPLSLNDASDRLPLDDQHLNARLGLHNVPQPLETWHQSGPIIEILTYAGLTF